MGDDGLAPARQTDFFVRVIGERNGTAQGHFVGRVTAHDRVFHGEIHESHIRGRDPHHLDACFGQVRCQLVARDRLIHKAVGQALKQVVLFVEKREPAWLFFLDDGHIDAVDHRKPFAFHGGRDRLGPRIIGWWLGLVELFAKIRIAGQADLGRASPFAQLECARTHRVLHDAVAIGLNHFARNDAVNTGVGQQVRDKPGPGFAQMKLHRVAINRSQAWDLGVVVEFAACLRFRAQFIEPENLLFLQAAQGRTFCFRVKDALIGIDHIVRGQFPLLATKRRIVCKVDALTQPDRIGFKVVGNLRQGLSQVWLDFCRPCQIIVGVERIENVGGQNPGIEVTQLGRVKSGFGDWKCIAQDFLGPGRWDCRLGSVCGERHENKAEHRNGEPEFV